MEGAQFLNNLMAIQSTLSPQDLKAIQTLDRKLAHQAAERIQLSHSINQKSRGFDIAD